MVHPNEGEHFGTNSETFLVTISEADWKHFKRIRLIALDRYCTAVLHDAQRICGADTSTSHERYLELYSLVMERNKAMSMPFDGLSRSSAPLKLKAMYDMGLVTDEEMQGFSEALQ